MTKPKIERLLYGQQVFRERGELIQKDINCTWNEHVTIFYCFFAQITLKELTKQIVHKCVIYKHQKSLWIWWFDLTSISAPVTDISPNNRGDRWNVFIRPPLRTPRGGGGKWKQKYWLHTLGVYEIDFNHPPFVTVNQIATLAMVTDCKTYRRCFHFYSQWRNFYSWSQNFYSQWWSLDRYTQDSTCKFCHRL